MASTRSRLRRQLQLAALALCVVVFMGAGDQAARFNKLGHSVMCTCGCAYVLLECNHVNCPLSDNMRNELITALKRGDSDGAVLQGFVQNYGPTVLLAPTASGFNYLAWIMPFVALTLGIGFVVFVVHSWKSKPAPALPDGFAAPQSGDLTEWQNRVRRETES